MAHSMQLVILILFTSFHVSCSAKQSFRLIFTDIKCTVNDKYIRSKSCILEKNTDNDTKLNIEAQMQKSMNQMRVDYSVNLDRMNKDSISLYKITNMDGCTAMFKNITSPLLKMLRDLLLKYGEWPTECPTKEDYQFKFTGLTLDPSYLPSFLPEADFKVLVTLYDRSVKVWHVQIAGKVAHQRRMKGNHKSFLPERAPNQRAAAISMFNRLKERMP